MSMRDTLVLAALAGMLAPAHFIPAAAAAQVATSAAHGPRAAGAELFGRGIFSTGLYELPPTFTRDGRTAYFTVSTPAYGRFHVIMETHLRGGRWTQPRVAPFSGLYGDADPVISPDGRRLFFISRRPVRPGGAPRGDFDIFYMERQGSGWGPPRHVAAASSPDAEHYVSAAGDGTLYIAAVRADSRGQGDIYRVPVVGDGYGEPENLGAVINSPDHETTPFVDPAQRYLIFSTRGRPDAPGAGLDLYISHRQPDGSWGPARNLGPRVNSARTEYCPVVSPDGRYLYFASERGFADQPPQARMDTREWMERINGPGNGLGDTYRIPMSEVLAAAGRAP